MTMNTLLCYANLRNIYKSREASRATATLEWLCRSGLMRYHVLTFT